MIKRAKNLVKHPLFSGSALMIGGSLAINGINYLYHLVMGRLLGPAGYGSLATIFSILYIVGIVPLSTSFAIVKYISGAKNERERSAIYKAIKSLLWKIGLVGLVVIIVFSPAMANFLHIDNFLEIALVGPILFFSLITLVNQSSMQGVLKFFGLVGPNSVSALAKLLFGVLLVYLGFSVSGAVVGVLLGAVLAYLFSAKLKGDLFERSFSKEFHLAPFFRFAFPVLVQALAFTSLFTVDVLFVKHFFSPFEAGVYAALSMLGKIIFFAAQPVTGVMFPIVSGRKSKGVHYRNVFYLAFLVSSAISSGIVGFYYLFPKIAIGMLYGEKYLSAQTELVWMGGFIAIYTASYMLANFLLSVNRTGIVWLSLLAAIFQAISIWFWHNSILQVIQVSLAIATLIFVSLAGYLVYNELLRSYAKSKA